MAKPKYKLLSSGHVNGGRLEYYEGPPGQGHSCAMGLDCAQGLADGDDDAAIILRDDGMQLFTACGKWGGGETFANVLWNTIQYYKPFIVGERQITGLACLRAIHERGYSWIYYQRNDISRSRERTDNFGHSRNQHDRIIPDLQAAITPRNDAGELLDPLITVRDEQLYKQLCQYQWNPRSRAVSSGAAYVPDEHRKMGAPPGEHDDLVLGLSYAWAGVQWLPEYELPKERPIVYDFDRSNFETPESLMAQSEPDRPFKYGK